MKIPKNAVKLEKIVAQNVTRAALENPAVVKIKDAHYLTATDGRMLVALPVEMEAGDVEGYIPMAAVKEAGKATPRYDSAISLSANGTVGIEANGAKMSYERNPGGFNFPEVAQVIPNYTKPESISFNAKYLLAIAKAINSYSNNVILTFERNEKGEIFAPITVSGGDKTAIALLMPVKM